MPVVDWGWAPRKVFIANAGTTNATVTAIFNVAGALYSSIALVVTALAFEMM